MTTLREAAQQALEAWDTRAGIDAASRAFDALRAALAEPQSTHSADCYQWHHDCAVAEVERLRAALAQQAEPTKETTMPITDDQGKALLPQYRVIEQDGNWVLLYDQMQVGDEVRHEFRIQKLRHDIALYPGISLAEAKKRFRDRVEADNE